jgi:predicted GIY-YIG superfamily endonuclease
MAVTYLLHFSRPYGAGSRPQHYLGSAENLPARVKEHRSGQGARLTAVVIEAGITFEVVRTWEGGRATERKLKKRRCPKRLCPLCQKGGRK